MVAGFSLAEVAEILKRIRPPFKHPEPPANGKPFSKAWVSARTRELKYEIKDMMSAPVA